MVDLVPPVQRRNRVARPQDHLRAGGQEPDEYVWGAWTTTGTTMTGGDVWYQWNQPYTTATTTTTPYTTTWQQWNQTTVQLKDALRRTGEAVGRTAEELAAMRQQAEEQAERARDAIQRANEERSRLRLAERERKAGAQERALALFLDLLTPEERASYEENGGASVKVRGQGGTWFRMVLDAVHGNIYETDEHGCRLGSVCVAPAMLDVAANLYMPLADGWIGQLLAIRHDLAHFRQKGNWSGVRPCAQAARVPPQRIDAVLAA